MATPLDLTTLESDVLDAMRRAILTEQERRQRVSQLPEQIGEMCRAAIAAGVPAAEVRAATEAGMSPEQLATEPPAPTEEPAG